MAVFMTIITLGAVFFVLPIILQQERDEAVLKARGVSATALVLQTWSLPGSARSAPTYRARFLFERSPAVEKIVDEARITRRDYDQVSVGAKVPIVYDPQQLSLAQVNFGDKVHRRHPAAENTLWGVLLFSILILVWFGTLMFLRDALRERRLRAS